MAGMLLLVSVLQLNDNEFQVGETADETTELFVENSCLSLEIEKIESNISTFSSINDSSLDLRLRAALNSVPVIWPTISCTLLVLLLWSASASSRLSYFNLRYKINAMTTMMMMTMMMVMTTNCNVNFYANSTSAEDQERLKLRKITFPITGDYSHNDLLCTIFSHSCQTAHFIMTMSQ